MMFIANKVVALFVGALFLEQNRTTASRLVLRTRLRTCERNSTVALRSGGQSSTEVVASTLATNSRRADTAIPSSSHRIPFRIAKLSLTGPFSTGVGDHLGSSWCCIYLLHTFLLVPLTHSPHNERTTSHQNLLYM
jgi:hypothetical protein